MNIDKVNISFTPNVGGSVVGLLYVALIVLKIMGYRLLADWSWWWVLLWPLLLTVGILLIVGVILAIVVVIVVWISSLGEKRKRK